MRTLTNVHMLILAPTELRNNLFNTLESVKKGETVCIKTKEENLYIISEKQYERLTHSLKTNAGSHKVSGKILGSLDSADRELKEYLILPK
jgi:PHD/YefM family antitoxin component YafN of YafNO toxin-antitoxin module